MNKFSSSFYSFSFASDFYLLNEKNLLDFLLFCISVFCFFALGSGGGIGRDGAGGGGW